MELHATMLTSSAAEHGVVSTSKPLSARKGKQLERETHPKFGMIITKECQSLRLPTYDPTQQTKRSDHFNPIFQAMYNIE